MGLLDRSNEDIIVYPEETVTDTDGNAFTRASTTGVLTRADIQPLPQSGTSARRAEQGNEGFETEQIYRLRFPRNYEMDLGPQARIEWNGERWGIFGNPLRFNSSPRTRHNEYTIVRS